MFVAAITSTLMFAEPISSPRTRAAVGRVERLDPAVDTVLDHEAKIELLADGLRWSEGPVWLPTEQSLVFSDVPANMSYRWSETGGISPFLAPSGYTGPFDGEPHQGSNGMNLDARGRLIICQHGDRRVARLEALNTFTTLADRFEGKRFNSPNDLCCTSGGVIFFTDPPYGLANLSAKREIDFSGVYRVAPDGTVSLVTRELAFPNGIALSPDERTLYVTSSDVTRPVVLAFDLEDGVVSGTSRLFFDAAPICRKLGIDRPMDGMATDENGNVWCAAPGGIVIVSPSGTLLGHLLTGRDTANCAFGGADGRDLFITAADALLRIHTRVRGATFTAANPQAQ